MTELRRLFIDALRLQTLCSENQLISLKGKESHYLNRVLRLKEGDVVNIVDGCGNLWQARLHESDFLQLCSKLEKPLIKEARQKTLICLAVVIPKKGFEDVLRMSCEMGVDIFQPLISERRVFNNDNEDKFIRWNEILRQSVEQSERLWIPKLLKTIPIETWLNQSSLTTSISMATAIATTRRNESKEFQLWLSNLPKQLDQVWVLIGPEGGWSHNETALSIDKGCFAVNFGKNILRTSTAAIAASQLMASWRRIKFTFGSTPNC